MWAARYWSPKYWAARYWTKVGSDRVIPSTVSPGRTIEVAAETRTIEVAAETRTIEVRDPMELQSFATPMHPEANHNYSVDFTKLFNGLGGDTIVGIPTITVDDPDPAPPGFTVVFVALTADLQGVIFNPTVSAGDQDDDAYKFGGVTVCIKVVVQTATGNTEPQQVHLTISDQCKL